MYRIDKSCLRTAFWGCGGCQWSHERFVHAASYTVHHSDTTTVSDCALLALSYPIQLSTSEQNSSDPTDHSLDTSADPFLRWYVQSRSFLFGGMPTELGVDKSMVRLDGICWQQGERCAVCSFYKAHSNQNLGKPTRPLAPKEVSSFASALLLLCV